MDVNSIMTDEYQDDEEGKADEGWPSINKRLLYPDNKLRRDPSETLYQDSLIGAQAKNQKPSESS